MCRIYLGGGGGLSAAVLAYSLSPPTHPHTPTPTHSGSLFRANSNTLLLLGVQFPVHAKSDKHIHVFPLSFPGERSRRYSARVRKRGLRGRASGGGELGRGGGVLGAEVCNTRREAALGEAMRCCGVVLGGGHWSLPGCCCCCCCSERGYKKAKEEGGGKKEGKEEFRDTR